MYLVGFPPAACSTVPSAPPPAAQPDVGDQKISRAVIVVSVVGGTFILMSMVLALWLVHRRRQPGQCPLNLPAYTTTPSISHLYSTTITSSSPSLEKFTLEPLLGSPQSRSAIGLITPVASTTNFFSVPEASRNTTRHLEVSRALGREDSPKYHGSGQGRSVPGIYERPASPRRIFFTTPRGNECRHTWEAEHTPRESRNKMLPEVPGETRRWI